MWHGWERREEAYTGFWWGNVRESDHFEDPGLDGRIILRLIFMKWDEEAWTGLIWLRTGTGGSTCKHGNEPSGFNKMQGIS
jgi:hypothetical protein